MTDVARFLDGLRLQREKCGRMAEVVEEQKKVLASQDVDALLALVARKGTLMEEIEALQKELGPLAESWSGSKGKFDPAVVREVEAAVEETRRVLSELVKLEEEGRSQMSGQRRDYHISDRWSKLTPSLARNVAL